MAKQTEVTIVGNLTADPELRYTQSGLAVANFTIASTPREFDRAANEWKDGETLFLRASVWRDMAEHVAASLTKGQSVVAIGKLKQSSYETKEGEKRTSYELDVEEVGPSLRYGTTVFTKSAPKNGAQAPVAAAQAQPAVNQAPAQAAPVQAPAAAVPAVPAVQF